jgi:hypothetical protein
MQATIFNPAPLPLPGGPTTLDLAAPPQPPVPTSDPNWISFSMSINMSLPKPAAWIESHRVLIDLSTTYLALLAVVLHLVNSWLIFVKILGRRHVARAPALAQLSSGSNDSSDDSREDGDHGPALTARYDSEPDRSVDEKEDTDSEAFTTLMTPGGNSQVSDGVESVTIDGSPLDTLPNEEVAEESRPIGSQTKGSIGNSNCTVGDSPRSETSHVKQTKNSLTVDKGANHGSKVSEPVRETYSISSQSGTEAHGCDASQEDLSDECVDLDKSCGQSAGPTPQDSLMGKPGNRVICTQHKDSYKILNTIPNNIHERGV